MAYIPNFREKQEMKKNARIAAGLVSERMPEVANIVLEMTYSAGPVNMKRTVNYLPNDYACFHMDCMRDECHNGGFDLAPVVKDLVKKHKRTTRGNLYCHGKSDNLRVGHANLSYEINVAYSKRSRH